MSSVVRVLCRDDCDDEKSLMHIDATANGVNNFHGTTSFEIGRVEEEDID